MAPSPARLIQIYALIQLLVLCAVYTPGLLGYKSFYFEDICHFFEPNCRFIADSLRNGHVPMWNPYSYGGMSQLAISSPGVAYPGTWLFALLPFDAALAVNMIAHQLLCGVGGALLATSLGCGGFAGIVCGAVLAMSGYMFSLSSNYTLVSTAAWLPMLLFSIRRFAVLSQAKLARVDLQAALNTVLASACATGLIAAGRPEISAPGLVIVAVYCIMDYARTRAHRDDSVLVAVWRLRALIIGALLAMPAILPSLEWLTVSRRAGGLEPHEVLLFSANWYDLLSMVASQPLGDLQLTGSVFRGLFVKGSLVPYMGAAFIGPAALTLAIWGAGDPKWKPGPVLLFAAVLSICAACAGCWPFALQLVEAVPSLSFLRFPIKFLFFTILAVAILAARGYVAVSEQRVSLTAPITIWGAGTVLSLLLLAGAAAGWPMLAMLVNSESSIWRETLLQGQIAIGAFLLGACVIAFATILIAKLVATGRVPINVWGAAALSLVCGPLVLHACVYGSHWTAPGFFKVPSYTAERLKQLRREDGENGRSIGLYLEKFTVPTTYRASGDSDRTADTYQYSRQLARPATNMDFAEPSGYGFEGSMIGEYFYFLLNAYVKSSQSMPLPNAPSDTALARLLQVMNVHYAVTQAWRTTASGGTTAVPLLSTRFFDMREENLEMNVRIYSLRARLPRACFVGSTSRPAPRDRVIEDMYDPDKSGFDPAIITLLDETGEVTAEGSQDAQNRVPQSSESGSGSSSAQLASHVPVTISESTPENVILEVSAPTRGFVVLRDQFFPGWRALVDGKPARIRVANAFTRAVAVEAGRHKVEFLFLPTSWWAGLLLALIGAIWLMYVMICGYSPLRRNL